MTVALEAMSGDRRALHHLVAGVEPWDEREATDRADILAWIASGAELYRRVPPADPPKHLVTYFLPYHADTDMLFLVEHRKAGLWLPPGGHVEAGEAPWDTVVREAGEELGIHAEPHPFAAHRRPLLVTVNPTVGAHSHTDCTLWYLLDLTPDAPVVADPEEFTGSGWFPRHAVVGWPAGRTDPPAPVLDQGGAAHRRDRRADGNPMTSVQALTTAVGVPYSNSDLAEHR